VVCCDPLALTSNVRSGWQAKKERATGFEGGNPFISIKGRFGVAPGTRGFIATCSISVRRSFLGAIGVLPSNLLLSQNAYVRLAYLSRLVTRTKESNMYASQLLWK